MGQQIHKRLSVEFVEEVLEAFNREERGSYSYYGVVRIVSFIFFQMR